MAIAAELPPPPALDALIVQEQIALFLDFDGTLIDIADTPGSILVAADLAQRLAALSDRIGGRLALISGRSVDDLEAHLGPFALTCAGSHGSARRMANGQWLGDQPMPIDRAITDEVAAFAAAEGAMFERKEHGAALHSRAARHLEKRCGLFLDELAARHGLCVKRGKFVAELIRPGADKGGAVRAFLAQEPFSGSRPVFVGDDVTDEDGFAVAVEEGGWAITVGPRDSVHASYGLADPAAVHHWLGL